MRDIETLLGYDQMSLEGKTLVRIDFPNPQNINVRMPTGNEAGANSNWIPGGKLASGHFEAVVTITDSDTSNFIQPRIIR